MRRFWIGMALILTLLLPARAADPAATLVRAFVYEDALYTYVSLEGNDQPITKADAEIGNRTFPAAAPLETVRQAGSPITYLLLLDASTSMTAYQEQIAAFAKALAAGGGENTRFILATFGRSFTVVEEDVPAQDVADTVMEISFTETSSRLLSGVQEALDYWESLPRRGSELRSMVILSDAVEYDSDGAVSYEELLERINGSDVMLHSLGFGSDSEALDSLSGLTAASGGRHWLAGDSISAAEAGTALSEENGALYVTSFNLTGFVPEEGSAILSVTFASNGELVCRAETEVVFPASAEHEPAGEEAEEQPAREEPAEPVPPQESDTPAVSTDPDGLQPNDTAVLLAAAAAAGILVLALVIFLLVRRRKHAASRREQGGTAGVYIRIEVLQGTLLGKSLERSLSDELVIGRDKTCAIAFRSQALSRRHARVFLAGGAVYLEDLQSQNGTFINGSSVAMPSLLRSGDEIQAGDVVFRLKF